MSTSSGVVWFRRDLRLSDNPAWAAATTAHDVVTPLYVLDDRLLATAGAARRHQHLAELHALDATLRDHGGRLLVRHGDPGKVVPETVATLGADGVYWNEDVTPYARRRDDEVRSALRIEPVTWWGHLVLPPGSVVTSEGRVSRVFGAFHRRWAATEWPTWPEPGDAELTGDAGDGLAPLEGDPPRAAGETAAQDALARFVDGEVETYEEGRDEIWREGTSGLSVALRFGTISPRHVVEAAGTGTPARAAFVRQLAWRDWYAHLLQERPGMVRAAVRPELDHVEWHDDPEGLTAWKEGRTGYPLVDAGMRELATTGAMHNRVRMVTASFLVKDLLVDWRAGEQHFRRLLVDADVPQNVGNWQWVAGTGPDAAPYFRVFNPVTQSRRHDPDGVYLRRWVPELAALDDRSIHAPWEAGPLELAAAGIELGRDYPLPIVDHTEARVRAIAAYDAARGRSGDR